MSKPVKELVVRDLASRYAQATNAVWVELVGVDGLVTNELRRDLRARHMRLEVVKNSLLRRACPSGPLARLAAELSGPAALVTGGESAVEVARVLEGWAPKLADKLRLRGAVLEGEYLDQQRVRGLSKMPSRANLQARLVGITLTPGGRVVGAILAGRRNLAGCLKTLLEKLEQGEEIKKSA
jgi:large subunit ribosomal protein L10